MPDTIAADPAKWSFTGCDQRLVEELQSQLPSRVFDAHAHLYRVADLGAPVPPVIAHGPAEAGYEVWQRQTEQSLGEGRTRGGLFFPFPARDCDIAHANEFLLQQLAPRPDSRALLLISPESSPERMAELAQHPQVAGLKCYHVFSKHQPTFESPIGGYLPTWAWRLCDEKGLAIMLHLVCAHAFADPQNQEDIVALCRRHPGAKLVLAHAARGFNAEDTRRGVTSLRGLENVWFDTAAICEPGALIAILNEFGPRRLLWGSDFPVLQQRGKCVSVGDGFSWINPSRSDTHPDAPAISTTLVGLESLRALLIAADEFGLNADDLQDIFHDNAVRLLQLKPRESRAGQRLYEHAKSRIPGGVQLLSKRPETFLPDQWPAYFCAARGCETWDLDGNRYYDMTINAVGSCLLGFRDPDVTRAVQRRINLGSMCTLNAPEEVELAELLCDIHPWAEQARFARSGGEIAAIAARIARATTGRSKIAICGYHGWQDWYLAANLGDSDNLTGHLLPGLDPDGVPPELRGTTLPFAYNDREALQRVLDQHGDELAAIIMEPVRHNDPDPAYLPFVQDSAHRYGALLIFDEITIGWRTIYGGAHLRFAVNPDMAIFAKTLSNGFPMAAVIGATEAMEGAHHSFISSTYWTESIGPTAALATLQKMACIDVPAHVARIGRQLSASWMQLAETHLLPIEVVDACPALVHFRWVHSLANELRTLYTQLMLNRGFLAGQALYATLAHTEEIMEKYDRAIDEVFAHIAESLKKGTVHDELRGPVAHSGFRRLVG